MTYVTGPTDGQTLTVARVHHHRRRKPPDGALAVHGADLPGRRHPRVGDVLRIQRVDGAPAWVHAPDRCSAHPERWGTRVYLPGPVYRKAAALAEQWGVTVKAAIERCIDDAASDDIPFQPRGDAMGAATHPASPFAARSTRCSP